MENRLRNAIETGDTYTLTLILETEQNIPWVDIVEYAIDLQKKDIADTIIKKLFAKYQPDDRIIRKLFRLALVKHLDSTATLLWMQISDKENSMNPEDSTALLLAVDTGLVRIAKEMIESGIFLDGVNENQESTLHLALKHGMEDVVDLLITRGADVRLANKDGVTALHIAARYGDISIAKRMLNRKAEVNAATLSGRTPIQDAVFGEQEAMVKFLLSNNADPDKQDNNGESALHLAYYLNRKPIIKMLLQHGANPSLKNNDGKTPARNIFESRIPKLMKECFVATVAYESSEHPDLDILRSFRDNVLVRHHSGRAFISWYYRKGPGLANAVSRYSVSRKIAKRGIQTLVRMMERIFR